MALTRDEAVAKLTKSLAEGGWSSIYSFVVSHVEDWELDFSDEEDETETDEEQ